MTTNQEFGREALCIASAALQELDGDHAQACVEEISAAISRMIDQHLDAMSKAAGVWVFCRNTSPDVSGAYLIELPNGSLEKVRYDTVDKSWIDSAGLERDPRRWFKPAEPPAPPPLPESEIEVGDLPLDWANYTAKSYLLDACNQAHKAAMRPLLERLIDQDKRLDKLLQDYKSLEARLGGRES